MRPSTRWRRVGTKMIAYAMHSELRRVVDTIPELIWTAAADGSAEFVNRCWSEYTGLTLEEARGFGWHSVIWPEDLPPFAEYWDSLATSDVGAHEIEARIRRADGVYRWFLASTIPRRDDEGRILRWYSLLTDIEELRRLKDRLHEENIALREQIEREFMFEEIVGASPALLAVLANIVRVAPTDSTVLIMGETGTGKELIARAIHRRSQRAAHPFITVHCAAVPTSLIASELFGHEKGAFTGALQRRQGRFELASSGSIFLDEVGELPAETQIALLRVLQERRFERLGSARPIEADVRVIAATNRDLQAALAAGSFRADLFYRLNVFPIELPPLRERKSDLPLLVEYFVRRYAERAGKQIRKIDKKTVKLCETYD